MFMSGKGGECLLCGGFLIFDRAVDERCQLGRCLLSGDSILGDGKLLHQRVKDLDRLGVFGRHLGGIGRDREESSRRRLYRSGVVDLEKESIEMNRFIRPIAGETEV
jgi:hypothetical protein